MGVRSRAAAAAVGFLVFVLLGRMYEPELWTAWWFYVGLGTALSAVFVEPFFNRPQDAIVNGVGALAAYWAAERPGIDVLWTGFALVACTAALSGMASALLTLWQHAICYDARQLRRQLDDLASPARQALSAAAEGRGSYA